MARLRMPEERRLFGANIVPTAAEIAPDPQRAWIEKFLNWDATWLTWTKPQVDLACGPGVGANCIRMIGGLDGVASGAYTQDYHDTRMEQLVSYCNSLGVHVLLCCSGTQTPLVNAIGSGLTAQQLGAMQATTIRRMQVYPNVVGVDLIQESQTTSIGVSFLVPMIQAVRDRGATLPLTCSAGCATSLGEDWLLGLTQGPILPSFDFISVHLYVRALDNTFFDQFFAAAPGLDIIIGEFGRSLTDGALTPTSDFYRTIQVDDFNRYMGMGSAPDPRVRGALMWAVADQSTTDNRERYGIYSDTLAPRSWLQNIMRRYTFGSVVKNNAARR